MQGLDRPETDVDDGGPGAGMRRAGLTGVRGGLAGGARARRRTCRGAEPAEAYVDDGGPGAGIRGAGLTGGAAVLLMGRVPAAEHAGAPTGPRRMWMTAAQALESAGQG